MTEVDQNPSNAISLDFHVDPQFVNRTLASQSLGVDQDLPLGRLADNITEELLSRRVVDLRVAAIKGELGSVRHQIVRLRSAMYFKYLLDGSRERCRFHYNIGVDDGVKLNVTGFFDPARFEATSPRDNLSRQRHVYVAGIATAVNEEQLSVEVRPLLIGFPYFVPSGSESGLLSAGHRSELHYSYVDQFRLTDSDMMTAASNDEIQRLFRMSEAEVKKAFASILGVSLGRVHASEGVVDEGEGDE
ncbi:MAG: hypothetical protein OXJ36_00005, partial [bacterium]|nr:hypothetical protein [bacterium]MDE0436778.1 hypothetical protein [bacterium]